MTKREKERRERLVNNLKTNLGMNGFRVDRYGNWKDVNGKVRVKFKKQVIRIEYAGYDRWERSASLGYCDMTARNIDRIISRVLYLINNR